jgi:hypothetical protein
MDDKKRLEKISEIMDKIFALSWDFQALKYCWDAGKRISERSLTLIPGGGMACKSRKKCPKLTLIRNSEDNIDSL